MPCHEVMQTAIIFSFVFLILLTGKNEMIAGDLVMVLFKRNQGKSGFFIIALLQVGRHLFQYQF